MKASLTTAIVNAITTMLDGAVTYNKGADKLRTLRTTNEVPEEELREIAQRLAPTKVPAYKLQVTKTGKPAPGSAYQRAVTRMLSETNPDKVTANSEAAARVKASERAAWDAYRAAWDMFVDSCGGDKKRAAQVRKALTAK